MDPPSPSLHRVAHIQPRVLNTNYTEPNKDWITIEQRTDTPQEETRHSGTASRRNHTPATSQVQASTRESSNSRPTSSVSLNYISRSSSTSSIKPARSLPLIKVIQHQGQSKEVEKVTEIQGQGQEVGKGSNAQGQGQGVVMVMEGSEKGVPPNENNMKNETSPTTAPSTINGNGRGLQSTLGSFHTNGTSGGPSATSVSTGAGSTSTGTTGNSSSKGTTPTSNGTAPSSNGTAPVSNSTAPATNGTAPATNGTTPTSNGATPASNGTAPATNGTADTSSSTATKTASTDSDSCTRVKPSMTSLVGKKKISWLKAIKSAKGDRKLNQVTRSSDVEEVIFNLLAEQDQVSVAKFWNVIKWSGLWHGDPRLRECREQMARMCKTLAKGSQNNETDIILDKDAFKKCISDNIWVIGRAFKKDLIIPEFRGFTDELEKIFLRCKENDAGEIPDSVPQLSGVDRDLWAVSVCTIDGQRAAFGDSSVPFCLESCAMPFNYALAVTELGADEVHKWVGFEPSGSGSNDLSLNHDRKPFNPLVNSGAIVILSMLRAGQCPADRFDYLFKSFKKLAGHEYIGFNNAVYLSEKDNSDRNYAICYNLQENGCTPGTPLLDTLDFHFQMGSVEITAESGAVMAATLANGGICPITCQRVLTTDAVRDTLSLMHCCGMYDYSGHFAFTVGLPAKSGIGGGIMLVIPHVMGICCFAPPVDNHGNSVRGLQFCEELVQVFTFHNYDCMGGSATKIDPCMRDQETSVTSVVKLLYGASVGDVSTIRRFALSGMDMSSTNYDGRTALHVAAAHGHFHIVKMLVERCGVIHDIKDRYGNTPLDGARRFGRAAIVDYLLEENERQKPTSLYDVLTKAMQSAKAASAMPAPVTSSVTSPPVKPIILEEGMV